MRTGDKSRRLKRTAGHVREEEEERKGRERKIMDGRSGKGRKILDESDEYQVRDVRK